MSRSHEDTTRAPAPRKPNNARPTELEPGANIGSKQFADFDLGGRTFLVTGGAGGIGLAIAEGIVEAGGKVYCLDREPEPKDPEEWESAVSRVNPAWGGELYYRSLDVLEDDMLEETISAIAKENSGLHGVVCAAGIQDVQWAVDYTSEEIRHVLDVNLQGVMRTSCVAAQQMRQYGVQGGSIVLVASMSGLIANKGLHSAAYNASKAGVIQLARSLAMEWSPAEVSDDMKSGGGIRVNALSPGHTLTPMVKKNLEAEPDREEIWKRENMMHRLAIPEEMKGPALFLLSRASSFVTGSNLLVDGGHVAW